MSVIDIQPKDKLTIFSINGMAATSKDEITVEKIEESRIIFKRGRKRALYTMPFPFTNDRLVFKGHKIILKTDFEHFGNTFCGNACYNLGGLPASEMRVFIEIKNINKNFHGYAKILCMTDDPEKPKLLYPELETSHAVIQRIKNKEY